MFSMDKEQSCDLIDEGTSTREAYNNPVCIALFLGINKHKGGYIVYFSIALQFIYLLRL